MLCDRTWGADIRRVNGLDVVVKNPFYGPICQDCALKAITSVVLRKYLKHRAWNSYGHGMLIHTGW